MVGREGSDARRASEAVSSARAYGLRKKERKREVEERAMEAATCAGGARRRYWRVHGGESVLASTVLRRKSVGGGAWAAASPKLARALSVITSGPAAVCSAACGRLEGRRAGPRGAWRRSERLRLGVIPTGARSPPSLTLGRRAAANAGGQRVRRWGPRRLWTTQVALTVTGVTVRGGNKSDAAAGKNLVTATPC
ncbi:hypothetical protein R5R35_008892 [Gryllus longicercus]|uniref:Uncharacterized protein n=1 Tax=Gryllus longicercus TaxID=2509291 RepID=A0AAN9VJC1_9ORTH